MLVSSLMDATWITLPWSIPSTVTLSPRWPVAWAWGSRLKISLVVSSYNTSLASGPRFSVHLAASAKASSGLQPLLMMTPDHGPELAMPFWACTDELTLQNKITVGAHKRVATPHLNGDYSMELGSRNAETVAAESRERPP